jgi:hypothetical protein
MAAVTSSLRQKFAIFNQRFNTKWANEFKLSYLFLQQIDLIFTVYAMSHGAQELNPLVRMILGSLPLIFLVKLLVPLLIVYLVPGGLLLPCIACQVFVLVWNIRELGAANLLF